MKYRAIIFDMDGVIVDTEPQYIKRREEFFGQYGIDLSHLSHSFLIGSNMKNTWTAILGEDFDAQKRKELEEIYKAYKQTHPLDYSSLLCEGVKEILEYAKNEGYKIGLASSSSRKDIDTALATHDLTTYFQVILSGDEFKETKPHPEIYLTAMEKLEVKPEETLVIEDSEKGILSAKTAGTTVWAIKDYRFDMNQSLADDCFENLKEIKEKLSKNKL
ncbi:MAG: HAD family phosphatase [Streptococcaceae bacterium]|nr:HAD family phosphatase [Streptococcaceae bacterium]